MAQANPFFDIANNPFLNPENNPFMDPKNNPFAGNNDLQKMLSSYEIPSLNIDGLLAAQNRNLEAISAANQSAFEDVQAVFARQAEIMMKLMEEATASIQDLTKAGAPKEQVAQQVELAKNKLEETAANIREISELTAKSQSKAFDILNARFNESIKEIQALAKTPKSKTSTKK